VKNIYQISGDFISQFIYRRRENSINADVVQNPLTDFLALFGNYSVVDDSFFSISYLTCSQS